MEPALQTHLIAALTHYFDVREGRPDMKPFAPNANQQGERMRSYCADLILLLEDATVVLMEVKEYDCASGDLPEFCEEQHAQYLAFEEIDVPIAYVYNAVEKLACQAKMPRPRDWPVETLRQINRSIPSELPDGHPNFCAHGTLLDWVQNGVAGSGLDAFGRALRAIRITEPSQLRNGLLVLIFGVSIKRLERLTPDEADQIYKWLTSEAALSLERQESLQQILGAAENVFNRFSPKPKPRPSRPPVPGGRRRP